MNERRFGLQEAAERWARTWEDAWPRKDVDAIAALYAPDAVYRSHPMREPVQGSALAYVRREFAREDVIRCRFGTPVVGEGRAVVEWWASWIEEGSETTLAGATVLGFDAGGRVVDHVDYWVAEEGRLEPYEGWGNGSAGAKS